VEISKQKSSGPTPLIENLTWIFESRQWLTTLYLEQTIFSESYGKNVLSANYLSCSQEMSEANQAGKGNAVSGE